MLREIDILDIKYADKEVDMFDLEVEDNHNFILGNGVISHNSGKSEVGTTIALQYVQFFNQAMKEGKYDKVDLFKEKDFKKVPIKFGTENICGGQSDYIYTLREQNKQGKMLFGQVWQIDETKDKIGGIGSFSELIEIRNMNNIVAKFMQAEIWITPLKFETRNAPFGLLVYKKDIVKRENWCLLYKIDNTAKGVDYHFMGWVNIPLHKDEKLRQEYNLKKNTWIKQEISGTGDKRIEERRKVADMLSKDPIFSEMNEKGTRFSLSKEQQLAYMEKLVAEEKIQNFNEVEKYRIMEDARMRIIIQQKEGIIKQFDEAHIAPKPGSNSKSSNNHNLEEFRIADEEEEDFDDEIS